MGSRAARSRSNHVTGSRAEIRLDARVISHGACGALRGPDQLEEREGHPVEERGGDPPQKPRILVHDGSIRHRHATRRLGGCPAHRLPGVRCPPRFRFHGDSSHESPSLWRLHGRLDGSPQPWHCHRTRAPRAREARLIGDGSGTLRGIFPSLPASSLDVDHRPTSPLHSDTDGQSSAGDRTPLALTTGLSPSPSLPQRCWRHRTCR